MKKSLLPLVALIIAIIVIFIAYRWQQPRVPPGIIKVGILHSLSGTMAIS